MPGLTCPRCGRAAEPSATVCPFDGTPLSTEAWATEDTSPGKGGGPPSSGDRLAVGAPLGDVTSPHNPKLQPDTDEAPVMRERDTLSGADLVGQKLGDYDVVALIGSGGMGEVYAGEQKMIGKKVAIKVLKPVVAVDTENVARMIAEARAVNAIRHENIVDIFNIGTAPDGRPYLVMDFLDGEPLDKLLDRRHSLAPLEVAEILEAVCSALAAAHAKGIIHRDLKPANLFVSRDRVTHVQNVKLLDFGLAKDLVTPAPGRTQVGMVVGTPDYIAPEQATALAIDARTDLYSMGVIAFEMLSGQRPFSADTVMQLLLKHVNEPPPRVSTVMPSVPSLLDDLVLRLMAKEPAQRPASADLVRRELGKIKRALREGATSISGLVAVGGSAPRLVPVPSAPRPSAPRASAPRVTGQAADQGPIPGPDLNFSPPSPDAMPKAVSPGPKAVPKTQENAKLPAPVKWALIAAVVAALAAVAGYVSRRPPEAVDLVHPAVDPAPAPPSKAQAAVAAMQARLADEELKAVKAHPAKRDELARQFKDLRAMLEFDPSERGVDAVKYKLEKLLGELH